MNQALGHLLWWRVGEVVNLTHDDLAAALCDTGIPLPNRPIPVDVYRRVASTALKRFAIDEHILDIDCHLVDTTDKMITHHLVATLKTSDGVTVMVRKVGDMAFYKPPRGQHSRARMRAVRGGGPERWTSEVEQFVEYVRGLYNQGVKGYVDSQAVRRIIRSHLATQGALYLDGPYFAQLLEPYARLDSLFDALGEDSYLMQVPLPDGEYYRALLRRGLERTINAGHQVVDESLWKILETE